MNLEVLPFVDGKSISSESAALYEVFDPSSGLRLISIPYGCKSDVDRAVASARNAFEDGRWSQAPPTARMRVLHRLAELIALNATELDKLDAGEMGKPVSERRASAATASSLVRFFAESIDKLSGDVYASDEHSLVMQRRVPRGVVAALVPWNFPTFNAAMKFAPALAAGNCVVLKPSELSSRSALRLAHLAIEAGVPPGVLNVVPGVGEEVGRALGLHHDVDMIAFTGSTEVGKLMLQYAGQSNMKVVVAECGGKAPQIVFADGVDPSAAGEAIADFLLTNQGQICSVGSRLLVEKSIEARILDVVVARMKKIVLGDALDPKTTFGPLASALQRKRVMRYIETAKADGAQLVSVGGGALPAGGGFYVEPAVFVNVSPTSKIAQEEIFGPVLSVISFEDEADALRKANGTKYGLIGYVWTDNLSRAMRMAKGLRSSVLVNAVAPKGEGPGHAFSSEPAGESGVGTEGGLAGLESYLRRQLVWINHG